VQALDGMLYHVLSMGSCSQLCLILHPHRVAVPFPPTFRCHDGFVQIYAGTTLLKAKFGITPKKNPQKSN
jgi:hypothetical protein